MHKPSWFRDDEVVISFAPTVGINKDGEELYVIDPATGMRTQEINDSLRDDVQAILDGQSTETMSWVPREALTDSGIVVPN